MPKPFTLPVFDQFFKAFSNASTDIIHLNDEQGNILFSNKASETLLGYSPDELQQLPAATLIHPEDLSTVANDMMNISESSSPPAREIRLLKKNGQFLDVEVRGFLVPTADGRFIGAVIRDISTRKGREEQEQMLNKKKLDSIGVLAGGIAHDFNNLLAAILGNIDLSSLYLEEDNKAAPLLKEAKKACLRSQSLTQQLLTFCQGGTPVMKPVHLTDIITECCRFSLRGANVDCRFSIAADLWPVNCDTSQISQVLQNLIMNSRTAMPLGGVITISAKNIQHGGNTILPPGKFIKIAMHDQGQGIPKQDLTHIFDPYFTTKGRGTDKGSGLGLAIVHSIISKHNGSIEVQSTQGKGATFTILLPASQEKIIPHTNNTPTPSMQGKGTIMVMDDEEMILDLCRQALTYMGYEVITAHEGHEAIQIYQSHMAAGTPLAAAILDVTIPGGMGGEKTAAAILAMDPEATLIVASGYSTSPIMTEPKQYGFTDILIKPFQIKEVAEVLRKNIKTKKSPDDTTQ